ncbi:uncharacterized protein LOC119928654 isoform X2 [Tachyglossus aculeatus]|uniref:uncharacterized protein LOC119928654 isoform X2 n=1 Tax=Tachyglossus aculeatus TaxID=9261 RepID=UPI0018F42F59|nr:uncharacterized protein LOC119928654 isoform X2 [Tachyglossus aculeatus]
MEEEEEEEEQPSKGPDIPEAQNRVDGVDGEAQIQPTEQIVEKKRCLVLLSSFARALFPKLHELCGSSSKASTLAPVPSPAMQRILLLFRTSSLQVQRQRMQELLSALRRGSRNAPAALIAVLVRPSSPAGAEEAQRLLLQLLGEPRYREPPGPAPDLGGGAELDSVSVEMEAFVLGGPRGTLHIMKAACRTKRAPRDKRRCQKLPMSSLAEEEAADQRFSEDTGPPGILQRLQSTIGCTGNRLLEVMSSKAAVLTAIGAAAVAAGAAGAAYYSSEH